MTRIYLDTSVISALFDERTPERLIQTEQAWALFADYEVCISSIVHAELSKTSDDIKKKLMKAIDSFIVLQVTDDVEKLAKNYIENDIFPEKYISDAMHVAVASLNKVELLLSWNFTHLVKVKTRRMIALVNAEKNYPPVEIISPPEL